MRFGLGRGVRYQLAFTLGEIRHPERLGVLAQIARHDAAEPMMRAAVLSSLAEGAGEMFSLLARETGAAATATGRPEILRELAAVVGAANQPADLARVREALVSTRDPLVAFPLARGLGDGLRRAGSSFEKAEVNLESLLGRAAATATDGKAPESVRLEAIALEHELVTYAWIDNASVHFPFNIYATKGSMWANPGVEFLIYHPKASKYSSVGLLLL